MQDVSKSLYTNELINESSLYLIQHAHNPVKWYPWNENVLKFALDNNKILLISIGYSACHWCHVMESESFMDEEVALLMNDNFLCIKVDREEHPDVDQLYMEAVQIINGNGGWPLNCFALADGRPFWGGTYFPKEKWKMLLNQIILLNKQTPFRLVEQANLIKNGILSNMNSFIQNKTENTTIDFNLYYDTISYQFDNNKGGSINAPKFPMPNLYQSLLHYYYISNELEVISHIKLTLNEMAKGGIYDQLGGGFARYSTDVDWKITHFEKMLYDNAQLISLYVNVMRYEKSDCYKTIIIETLNFLENELQSKNGMYYSSLDADSEGIEGKYYIWTNEEIRENLGKNTEIFNSYYNVTEQGNWENKQNILYLSDNEDYILKKYDLDKAQLNEIIRHSNDLLLKERKKRIKPSLDTKIIISWNSLMIKALIDVYSAFGDEKQYDLAKKNINSILDTYFSEDGKLLRIKDNRNKVIYALLDDYAFFIEALLAIYQVDADPKWLKTAKELVDFCLNHFYDESKGLFYYNSDFDDKLFLRNKELIDNVMPSSNSVLYNCIHLLSIILDDSNYKLIVSKGIQLLLHQIEKYPAAYSNWLRLLMTKEKKFYIVSIIGENAKEYAKLLSNNYLPDSFILFTQKESDSLHFKGKYVVNKTLIYICSESECYEVYENVDDAISFLKKKVSL
jgi:hypothetical protein